MSMILKTAASLAPPAAGYMGVYASSVDGKIHSVDSSGNDQTLTLWGSGTLTTSNPLAVSQTWNAGGVTFDAATIAITDTASASGSRLIRASVGGVDKFVVDKAGYTGIGVIPTASLHVKSAVNDSTTGIRVEYNSGTPYYGRVRMVGNDFYLDGDTGNTGGVHYLTLGGTVAVKVTPGGAFKHSSNGTFGGGSTQNEFYNHQTNGAGLYLNMASATSIGVGLDVAYTNLAPNNTAQEFVYCNDMSALRFKVASNGGIYNYQANNSNLSDLGLKPYTRAFDIEKLWRFGKAMRPAWLQFKYEDQTHNDWNNGYGAQLVREAAGQDFPELTEQVEWGRGAKIFDEAGEWTGQYEKGPMRWTVYDNDLLHLMGAITTELQYRSDDHESRLTRLEAKVLQ